MSISRPDFAVTAPPAMPDGALKFASTLEVAERLPAKRVAIIDDDRQVREAFTFQLHTAGFAVSAYASAHAYISAIEAKDFDCIVADVHLPAMNGLELQEQLKRVAPCASVVFVTGYGDLGLGMHAMRNGAVDFLEKPVDDATLLASVTRGVELAQTQRMQHGERSELEERYARLTPREREVFVLITKGLLNKQAGAELGTTERTVKAHRGRVMAKMGAGSLADLIRMAAILKLQADNTPS